MLILALLTVPVSSFGQAVQSPATPAAPVPQLAPKPGPRKPAKAAPPPPPAFPSVPKWSATVDAAPAAPPLAYSNRVVLALQSGVLSSRQMSDGKEAWSAKLAVDQPLAADGDRIFAIAGTSLHALNAATGASLWSVEVGTPSAPLLARGGWVIAASEGTVTALRADTGEKVWSKALGKVSERPAIEGHALYLPLVEGHLLALNLETATVIWDQPVGGAPSEPLAYDGRVYFGSDRKRFVCLKAETGVEEWFWEIGTRVIGPAAADASTVYFTAMDNVLRGLNRRTGNQRWRISLTYRPTRGPVLMDRQIAVPGITSELTGIDVATGKPTGKLTFPVLLAIGPAFVAPEGSEGAPAVVSITGGLTSQWTLALSMPAPPPEPATPEAPKAVAPAAPK